MNDKKGGKIILIMKSMYWFLLAYLVVIFFIPQVISPANMFIQPFMGVYIAIYSIVNTIIMALECIALVTIYIMTYTTKLDDYKKEPTVPEYSPLWKSILGFVKNIAIVYFASNFGMGYIAAITSLAIIYSIFYSIVRRDFFTKMTKLKLAYKG